MQRDELNSIIQFAIEKEQEAADFYTDLADRVRFEGVAEEMKKLAAMERRHKEKLENLDVDTFIAAPIGERKDMRIADYIVKAEVASDMTWQDVLNIAMHRELAAVSLYNDLAASVEDQQIKQLFHGLAAEEQKHKLYLETLWDQEVMKEN